MQKVIISIETTGLNPKKCGIWAVNMIILRPGENNLTVRLQMNPGKVKWDDIIKELIYEDVIVEPKQKKVFKSVLNIFSHGKTILYLWNDRFTVGFLSAWFKSHGYDMFKALGSPSVDLQQLCIHEFSESDLNSYGFGSVCTELSIDQDKLEKVDCLYEIYKGF